MVALPAQREVFKTSRALDFFTQRELTAQIGHEPELWPRVAVKELVDNALDGAEEAGGAPEISVEITADRIVVADNGPGINPDTVPAILDYGIRASSREAMVGPARGAQGNALKTILAMPFVLDGKRGDVVIESRGSRYGITIEFDPIASEPRFTVAESTSVVKTGLRFELRWPQQASLWDAIRLPDFYNALAGDLSAFAAFNPHAAFRWSIGEEDHVELAAADPAWRRWKASDPLLPGWYEGPRLARFVAAQINADRTAGRRVRTVRELVAMFRGHAGSAAQKRVTEALGLTGQSLEALLDASGAPSLLRIVALRQKLMTGARPIKPTAMGVLGRANLDRMVETMLPDGVDRDCKYDCLISDAENSPAVLELMVAYHPGHEHFASLAGINNSPALLGRQAFGIEGLIAEHYVTHDTPLTVLVHVIGARLQFGDRGKSRLQLPFYDLGQPLHETLRKRLAFWKKQVRSEIRDANAFRKRHEAMHKPQPPVSHKSLVLRFLEEGIAAASGDGTYSFNQRSLFYVIRKLIAATGHPRELQYSNFTPIITDHEAELGSDIPGMVRDPRGSLYIPHAGIEIQLGTADVENFRRPNWTINKLLAIEKEGYYEILKQARWPERHDCAIMSSKGYFSRAARDVADLMGVSDEPLQVFLVHDADAPGSVIAHAFTNATKARAARTVNVTDLGISPWQGLGMGLEPEPAAYEKRQPTGESIRNAKEPPPAGYESWEEWLQTHRIELNAMTSPQFIEWLDAEFESALGKVIPPANTADDELKDKLEAQLEDQIREEILREAKLEERVAEAAKAIKRPEGEALLERIKADLVSRPTSNWRRVIAAVAGELVASAPR